MRCEASLIGLLNYHFLPSQRETTNTLPHPHDDDDDEGEEEEEEEEGKGVCHAVTSFSTSSPGSLLFTATLRTVRSPLQAAHATGWQHSNTLAALPLIDRQTRETSA